MWFFGGFKQNKTKIYPRSVWVCPKGHSWDMSPGIFLCYITLNTVFPCLQVCELIRVSPVLRPLRAGAMISLYKWGKGSGGGESRKKCWEIKFQKWKKWTTLGSLIFLIQSTKEKPQRNIFTLLDLITCLWHSGDATSGLLSPASALWGFLIALY